MKKLLLVLMCFVLNFSFAYAKHPLPEKYYQQQWCKEYNGTMEYPLVDGSRIDCLTEEYAVEFDFAPKWAESIGQSLYYASKTGKSPGIVLIIENRGDFKHYYKIQKLCHVLGISLWYMEMPENPENIKMPESIIDIIVNFVINLLSQIGKIFTQI